MSLNHHKICIIAGPTASGKSSLGKKIVSALNGIIINADSLQVYQDLHILTARDPIPPKNYHLYGILKHNERSTAFWWAQEAAKIIDQCFIEKKIPILIGGSGFYIDTLLKGLSPIPSIDSSIRQEVKALACNSETFYDQVMRIDPKIHGNIHPNHTQKLMRALEVFLGTKQSIMDWYHYPPIPFVHAPSLYYYLEPERSLLYNNIDQRFDQMMAQGALEEARTFLDLPQDTPLLKTLGIRELQQYIKGTLSIHEAIHKAKQSTKAYAKRQMTWFRNKINHKITLYHTMQKTVDQIIDLFNQS